VLARQLDGLSVLVKNLLIYNPNLKSNDRAAPPYFYRAYPHTPDFVREVLRDHVEYILEKIDAINGIAVRMTEDIDLNLPN
jgi:hypothetical protein